MKHMSPAKATRFWAPWQVGEGDYLVIREQLFAKETVKSLSKKEQEVTYRFPLSLWEPHRGASRRGQAPR